MEVEFVALVADGIGTEWPRNLLLNIKLQPQLMPTISLYYDSEANISRVFSEISNGKSRHVRLRYEFVRQLLYDGIIIIIRESC
jgi:hypothetical protein